MVEENIGQEFTLLDETNKDKTKNCFIKEINLNELISKKHKETCTTLYCIKHLLTLFYAVTGCVSISTFTFLVGIPIGITSSAVELKYCAITAGIKK